MTPSDRVTPVPEPQVAAGEASGQTVGQPESAEPAQGEANLQGVTHAATHVTAPKKRRWVSRTTGAVRAWGGNVRQGFSNLRREPRATLRRAWHNIRDAVLEYRDQPVTFGLVFAPLLVLSALVYTRSFWTNYIFDEQEALLANPYVNGTDLRFWDVFKRDFWGLPPTRTIGSYRPIPNIIWWLLWKIKQHAWLPHFANVIFHAVNGALLASLAHRWFRSRLAGWLAGLALVLAAVITEAVAGVVGLADVLGGTFILLCLVALAWRWYWAALGIWVGLFLGLLCKESTLTVTPIVAWAALVCAPLDHPTQPRRWLRFFSAALAAIAAVACYTYFRRYFFPIKLPADFEKPLADSEPFLKYMFHEFLRWFQQPKFSADPINNPLALAEPAYRIAGALRVYWGGLTQVVFPWTLSGDYSFPQEPVPSRLLFPGSILGGLFMLVPPIAAIWLWGRGVWIEFTRRLRLRLAPTAELLSEGYLDPQTGKLTWLTPHLRELAILALAAMWIPFTYFPQSNIPITLPTVRAERFWYVPVLGSSLIIAWLFLRLWRTALARHWVRGATIITVLFFGFQAVRARMHALDYRNDLTFWRATAQAVPNSGKAHLNYGVMLGARSRLDLRLEENRRAMELAPQWPMANIYYADTLCRLHRPDEAFPHYQRGFDLGPNDQFMIALALQCLWDEKAFERYKEPLKVQAEKHKGSWVAFLVNDMITNGEKHTGVDPKYRPRGYNQGPRKD